jgi:hypothetical protein
MNLLQYAITLMSLFNLDNRCVMFSGECRSTTYACLISRFPVGVLNFLVSQFDGFCDDLCGPFHHGVDVEVLKAYFLLK